MIDKYLIWWTSQEDCERIVPLDIWPTYLADEYESRNGRAGRGRLWCHDACAGSPQEVTAKKWDPDNNWLCKAAGDAGGVVIKAEHVRCVQFLPGFVTTFAMELPAAAYEARQV